LQVALDQGDALNWAKGRVGARKWKTWREENCPRVKERTDALHRRLAKHRARIEQELQTNPDLGVAEAAALISTRKPKLDRPLVVKRRAMVPAVAKTTAPTVNVVRAPATPMGDSNRTAVINLALKALSVSRRPVSAPNVEIIQDLLGQIIAAVKMVTQPAKPLVCDTTAFDRAMGIAASLMHGDVAAVH
jgi:hypothetical protein